jgi:hypothetical protein
VAGALCALTASPSCRDSGAPAIHETPGRDARAAQALACSEAFSSGLGLTDASSFPSFRRDLMPLFATHCSFGGCHVGEDPTGQMHLGESCEWDLRKGACLVDARALSPDIVGQVHENLLSTSNAAPGLKRVEPGRLDRSFLLLKLSGCQNAFPRITGCVSCGEGMPPNTHLRESDPELFLLIARWVAAGAPLD